MLNRAEIDIRLETIVDPKFMRNVLHQYDAAVVAAGARIEAGRSFGAANGMILDAMDVALGKAVPGQKVVVLGGGKIGLTLAESLKQGGADVTIVERRKRIGHDVSPTWKWRHAAWVEELGIPVMAKSRVEAAADGEVTIVDGDGEEVRMAADTLIIAETRTANQELYHELQWMIDELHMCGDAVSPRGLDQAIHEGYGLGSRI